MVTNEAAFFLNELARGKSSKGKSRGREEFSGDKKHYRLHRAQLRVPANKPEQPARQ